MSSDAPRLNVKAVLVGLAVDWVGTILFSTVVGIVVGLWLVSTAPPADSPGTVIRQGDGSRIVSSPRATREEWNSAEIEQLKSSPYWEIPLSSIGLFFTGLGGYVAARIAKRAELKHALAMGLLSLITGLTFSAVVAPERLTRPTGIAGAILVLPAAALGGYLRRRQSIRTDRA